MSEVQLPADPRPIRRLPAGNLSTGWLKLTALFFMFIDHSGKVLFNNMQEMRILGRIAFPIYLWCMVVGFCRTRSVPRYLLRIALVGLVSQPLYVLALDSEGHIGTLLKDVLNQPNVWQLLHRIFLQKPNIFLTLLLGLTALWGIREKKFLSQLWAPAAAIALATVLNADYGWQGVLLLILLYAVRDSRPGIASVMVAFMMYWGTFYRVTTSFFRLSFNISALPAWISSPLGTFMRMEAYSLLALPMILVRFPEKDLRMPKWVSYAIYPGHLVLLIILKLILFGWK